MAGWLVASCQQQAIAVTVLSVLLTSGSTSKIHQSGYNNATLKKLPSKLPSQDEPLHTGENLTKTIMWDKYQVQISEGKQNLKGAAATKLNKLCAGNTHKSPCFSFHQRRILCL
jgi:hypothetical protein